MNSSQPDVPLSPDTVLTVAPGVRTRRDAAGRVVVDSPDGAFIDAGPGGYALLALFAKPVALGDAMRWLEESDAHGEDLIPAASVDTVHVPPGSVLQVDYHHGDRARPDGITCEVRDRA